MSPGYRAVAAVELASPRGEAASKSGRSQGFTLLNVGIRLVRRRLEDVQRRLSVARESLHVLEEQVAVWNDALDESRIRALVSETPLQAQEYGELSRHVAAANAELTRRRHEVEDLVIERDDLLRSWTPKD